MACRKPSCQDQDRCTGFSKIQEVKDSKPCEDRPYCEICKDQDRCTGIRKIHEVKHRLTTSPTTRQSSDHYTITDALSISKQCQDGAYCEICTDQEKCTGFRKLQEIKDRLTIYSYTDGNLKKEKLQVPSNILPLPHEIEDLEKNIYIIVCNNNDKDENVGEYIEKMDERDVSCPTCRKFMTRAKDLLKNVSVVEKKGIKAICDECTLQQGSLPCTHCRGAINKFKTDNLRKVRTTHSEGTSKTSLHKKKGKKGESQTSQESDQSSRDKLDADERARMEEELRRLRDLEKQMELERLQKMKSQKSQEELDIRNKEYEDELKRNKELEDELLRKKNKELEDELERLRNKQLEDELERKRIKEPEDESERKRKKELEDELERKRKKELEDGLERKGNKELDDELERKRKKGLEDELERKRKKELEDELERKRKKELEDGLERKGNKELDDELERKRIKELEDGLSKGTAGTGKEPMESGSRELKALTSKTTLDSKLPKDEKGTDEELIGIGKEPKEEVSQTGKGKKLKGKKSLTTKGKKIMGKTSTTKGKHFDGKKGKEGEGKGTEGKGTEGKGTEGKGTEGKGTEGEGTEGKDTEGKETKGKETMGENELELSEKKQKLEGSTFSTSTASEWLKGTLTDKDIRAVSCSRCRYLMTQARNLLKNLSSLDKKETKEICDLCTLQQTLAPCEHCQRRAIKERIDEKRKKYEKSGTGSISGTVKKQYKQPLTPTEKLYATKQLKSYSGVKISPDYLYSHSQTVIGLGTTGIIRKSHSETSSITSLSTIADKKLSKTFEYYFPGEKAKERKIIDLQTSEQLIQSTQDKLKAEAEEKARLEIELEKNKIEKLMEQKLEREKHEKIKKERKNYLSDKEYDIEMAQKSEERGETKERTRKEGEKAESKSKDKEGKRDKKVRSEIEDEKDKGGRRKKGDEKSHQDKGREDKEKKSKHAGEEYEAGKDKSTDKGKEPKSSEKVSDKSREPKSTITKETPESGKESKEKDKIAEKDKKAKEKESVAEKGKESKGKEMPPEKEKEPKRKESVSEKGKESKGKEIPSEKVKEPKRKESVSEKGKESKGKEMPSEKVKEPKVKESLSEKGKESKGKEMPSEKVKEPKGKDSVTEKGKESKGKEMPPEKGKEPKGKESVTEKESKGKQTPPEERKEPKRKETPTEKGKESKSIETLPEKGKEPKGKETPAEKVKEPREKETPKEKGKESKGKETLPEKGKEPKGKETPAEKVKEPRGKETPTEKAKDSKGKETLPEKGKEPKGKETPAEKGKEPKGKETPTERGKKPKETMVEIEKEAKGSTPGSGKGTPKEKGKKPEGEHVDLLNDVLRKQEKEKAETVKGMAKTTDGSKASKLVRQNEKEGDKQVPKPKDEKGGKKRKEMSMKEVEIQESGDDLILKMVKMRSERPVAVPKLPLLPPPPVATVKKRIRKKPSICSFRSDLELDAESLLLRKSKKSEVPKVIYGKKIVLKKDIPVKMESTIKPALFQTDATEEILDQDAKTKSVTSYERSQTPETKGPFRYSLSNRRYIDNGWTVLPIEKIVRKVNIYRMSPANPDYDWFKRNKAKLPMWYDTKEKMADVTRDGRGRWYYRNGKVALEYYESEELNTQQRVVVYSSGSPDQRGHSLPVTVLGMFDFTGNGVVFDHHGKIRLKYNQNEGVVLDRNLGPVTHWLWHSLNEPPDLKQVMIDTHLNFKDPEIFALSQQYDDQKKVRQDDEDMIAIEIDNYIKARHMSSKDTKEFKPHQISMKALKINDQFSLKVINQKTVHLLFRDGQHFMKLNLGMQLDHNVIIDSHMNEVGEVALTMEKQPALSDSVEHLQKNLQNSRRLNRVRVEKDLLRHRWLSASVDKMTAAASKPLRLPPLADAGFGRRSKSTLLQPTINTLLSNTRLI